MTPLIVSMNSSQPPEQKTGWTGRGSAGDSDGAAAKEAKAHDMLEVPERARQGLHMVHGLRAGARLATGVDALKKKRDLKMDQYGISRARYRELYYFCLQYPEFVKGRQDCYSLDGRAADGRKRGAGARSDPTPRKAERANALGECIELIERTAAEASGDLYPWVMQAVTEGLGFSDIGPPCGKNEFYMAKRKFYYLLSLKK